MRISFKGRFQPEILERGYNYYKQGRVANLLKAGNKVTANVHGTHKYKVVIDVKTLEWRCNCPYDGNCKHIVAVCYEINNSKRMKSTDDMDIKISKRSKEELTKVIKNMIADEPRLAVHLLDEKGQIENKVDSIDELDEEDEWQEFYDYIPDRVYDILEEIEKFKDKMPLLLRLLEKAQEMNIKYDYHGSTEDSVMGVLERIKGSKKGLPRVEQSKIDLKVKEILETDYKSYMDSLANE